MAFDSHLRLILATAFATTSVFFGGCSGGTAPVVPEGADGTDGASRGGGGGSGGASSAMGGTLQTGGNSRGDAQSGGGAGKGGSENATSGTAQSGGSATSGRGGGGGGDRGGVGGDANRAQQGGSGTGQSGAGGGGRRAGASGGGSSAGGSGAGAAGNSASGGGKVGIGGSSASGGAAPGGGGAVTSTSTPQIPAKVLPTVETEDLTASNTGAVGKDVADDSAIYANRTSPELSVVVADNKDESIGGVGVFDMQGKLLQFRQDGQIGNIDLREGFPFGGGAIVLVGANNRTDNTLIFWQLEPATRKLSAPISSKIATTSPNYGFCLYHSATTGKFYAFVSQETGNSVMEQYELGESGGKVTGTKVRSFEVGSITEGCVVDDELGRLYVAQEDVALWRYGAEPSAGADRTKVAEVDDGHLVADLEGLTLAKGPGTSGYLVVSVQSQSKFVSYDWETNAFLREFTVGSNGSIDAPSQTDGLDISTANLGPGFAKGALVVHDGSNTGGATSNLKFVPLE